MKKVDIKIEKLHDKILAHINLKNGFKSNNEIFEIQFFNNDTMKLLYVDCNIKFGMYAGFIGRDIDVLVKVLYGYHEIYNKVIPKITTIDLSPKVSEILKELNDIKVSIIIPTMTLDLVKKCIQSLLTYTDLNNTEVIIVVQCPSKDKMERYTTFFSELIGTKIGPNYNIEQCKGPFKVLWFDNPLGAVVSYNEGIKKAKGEYVLLLNDDCEILHSEKNYWLNTLLEPFEDNDKLACTGPFRMLPVMGQTEEISLSFEDASYGFILFFCAMIPRRILEEVNYLDESLKCGVDIDFCLKAKRLGYSIKQVPTEDRLDTSNPTHHTGVFPIWHQAEATVHDFYGVDEWHKLMQEDRDILEERYGTKLKKESKNKISIVIPVYGDHFEDFQKCLNSLQINTTFSDNIEVIVIANGCKEDIKVLLELTKQNADFKFDYYWYDEPLGATSALNRGMEYSTGDIIILLNQDVVLLGNNWLQMLIDPFNNPKIGISGPLKGWNSEINRHFVLFFCVAIRREVINQIGILDEGFNPGGFEDIDFCVKAEDAGWKLIQTPDESLKSGESFLTGGFPIYHVEHHSEWMKSETFEKNRKIIFDRYGNKKRNNHIDITWPVAQKKFELEMVQEFLKNERIENVLEVGTYRGGTAMLWANIVSSYNGRVTCADMNFNWGRFQDHGYVGTDLINYDRQVYNGTSFEKYITELQGDSHNIEFINKVKDHAKTVDILFIDGDHSYEGVKQDFENFYSTVKLNGYIIFHDIIDSEYHRSFGCNVAPFWNEIKDLYPSWELVDSNEYPGCPSKSMGIGIIKKNNINLQKSLGIVNKTNIINTNKGKDVLCNICTKKRYLTTLPLAIQSVIMQTVKPDRLIIFDDNIDEDKIDLRENEVYKYLFDMLDFVGIKWEVIYGFKQGQHHGHQYMNKREYKFVWRLDDDEIASPDVLEKYLSHMKDDVGAVGGSVLLKGCGGESSPRLEDIYSKANVQWNSGNKIIEVDHLHSTFLYRANIVNYNLDLSPVAHREETLFTQELKQKGYKLIVDQTAITHHLKQQTTGIRSHNNEWLYKHDEKIFSKKMEEWGYKLINLNSGLGDHYAFLNILPKLKEKYKHLIIGASFPEVFKDEKDITLIHNSQAEPNTDDNIYKWMIDNNWTESIVKAYEHLYGVNQ